jgi:hypothetical protein
MKDAPALARETKKRRRMLADGSYVHRIDPYEVTALHALLADIRETEGVRLVVHTPPTSDLYREILAKKETLSPWCEVARDLHADGELQFIDAFASPRFESRHFDDWVHLNHRGSRRYVRRLFTAMRSNERPPPAECE